MSASGKERSVGWEPGEGSGEGGEPVPGPGAPGGQGGSGVPDAPGGPGGCAFPEGRGDSSPGDIGREDTGLRDSALRGDVPRDGRLAGFAQGGEWDGCPPGPELVAVVAGVAGPGWRCPGAGPDELAGVLRRVAAVESWASSAKLAVIREMIRRDGPPAPGRSRHGDLPDAWSESLDHELALALACSVPSAQRTVLAAWELGARLPGIAALLADGTLTYGKAKLITETFQLLSDADAAKAEALILPRLAGRTYGQVANLASRAAAQVDPGLAERRRKGAVRHASRVEVLREQSGAAALCGRELPPDEVLAADASVTARALQYQESGAFPGARTDQLRSAAYLDLINGRTAETRIALGHLPTDPPDTDAAPGADTGPGNATFPASRGDDSGYPDSDPDDSDPDNGDPGDGGPGGTEPPGGNGPGNGGPGSDGALDGGPDGAAPSGGNGPGDSGEPGDSGCGTRPSDGDSPGCGGPGSGGGPDDDGLPAGQVPPGGNGPDRAAPGGGGSGDHSGSGTGCGEPVDSGARGSGPPGGKAPSGHDFDGSEPGGSGVGGPVPPAFRARPAGRPVLADLVIPLATLLGLGERPGEAHRLGVLDPDLCRDLAALAAASPRTQLCVTVTDSDGTATGHGCARPVKQRPGKQWNVLSFVEARFSPGLLTWWGLFPTVPA